VSGNAFQRNHFVEVHRLNLGKPGLRCRKNFRQGKEHLGRLCDQGNLGYSRNEKCPMGWNPECRGHSSEKTSESNFGDKQ